MVSPDKRQILIDFDELSNLAGLKIVDVASNENEVVFILSDGTELLGNRKLTYAITGANYVPKERP